MTSQINQIVSGTYPGGDTSKTLQLRATSTGNVTQQAMLIRIYGI